MSSTRACTRFLAPFLAPFLATALGACTTVDAPLDAGSDAPIPPRPDAGPDAGLCQMRVDAAPPMWPDGGPVDPAPAPLDCGTPTFPVGTTLRRRPYLQSTSETTARVAWTTTSSGRGTLRFGPSASGPWTEVTAAEELFDRTRTEDEPVDFFAYDAPLTGLTPGTQYCYEVLEDGVPIATGLRFTSAWRGTNRPLRMLAFGDSGSGEPGQLQLRDRVLERIGDVDIFLHLGDIAYGSGTFNQFHERFFVPYQDFLHAIPTWPTIGNHEMGTHDGQPYLDVFYLPEDVLRASERERYYSFDWGDAHFVALDSNADRLVPILLDVDDLVTDDMLDWARADLAASDAEWQIAFFHHTPYSSSERGINTQITSMIVPVLEAAGVDLVLAGHDHHYERAVPLRGSCTADPSDPDAVTYITNGAGGAGLRPATGDWFTAFAESDVHSFLLLEIRGCLMTGEAIDADGNVIDEFEVYGCE